MNWKNETSETELSDSQFTVVDIKHENCNSLEFVADGESFYEIVSVGKNPSEVKQALQNSCLVWRYYPWAEIVNLSRSYGTSPAVLFGVLYSPYLSLSFVPYLMSPRLFLTGSSGTPVGDNMSGKGWAVTYWLFRRSLTLIRSHVPMCRRHCFPPRKS